MKPDVTVVGAGVTGLTAAIEVAERGWFVRAAEALAEVGGKVDLRYYNDPRTEDEEEALRVRAATNVKILMRRFDAKNAYFYPRDWVENRCSSVPRTRWISRLREIGYLDSPGVLGPEETQSNGTVVTTGAANCGEA